MRGRKERERSLTELKEHSKRNYNEEERDRSRSKVRGTVEAPE